MKDDIFVFENLLKDDGTDLFKLELFITTGDEFLTVGDVEDMNFQQNFRLWIFPPSVAWIDWIQIQSFSQHQIKQCKFCRQQAKSQKRKSEE